MSDPGWGVNMAFIGPRPPCLSLSSCDLGRFSYSAAGGQTSIGRVCGVAQRPPRGAPVRGHHLPPILDREAHAAIGDSILFCTIVFPSRARMLAVGVCASQTWAQRLTLRTTVPVPPSQPQFPHLHLPFRPLQTLIMGITLPGSFPFPSHHSCIPLPGIY